MINVSDDEPQEESDDIRVDQEFLFEEIKQPCLDPSLGEKPSEDEGSRIRAGEDEIIIIMNGLGEMSVQQGMDAPLDATGRTVETGDDFKRAFGSKNHVCGIEDQ